MAKQRNSYFDFLRGLAVIMVVGIHTFRGYDFETVQGWFSVTVRQILNCAVPLFLAISGFFTANKDLSTRKQREAFWSHQIPKVYIPALVWGIPWLAIAILCRENALLSIVSWVCCGLSIFYYIALIIQYYLLLPVIQQVTPPQHTPCLVDNKLKKLNNKTITTIIITTIISLLCVAIETYVRCVRGVELPLIVYAGLFPLWILFFVMGVVLSRSNRDYKVLWIVVIMFVCLVFQVFESRYLNGFHGNGGFGQKTSSFVFSAMMILLLFSSKTERLFDSCGKVFSFITWIGSISFGIYLTHCLWIMALSRVIQINSWAVAWVIVLFFDIVFVMILKKIIPIRIAKYLGL